LHTNYESNAQLEPSLQTMARNPTSVLTTTAPRKLEMETWLKASGGKVSARKPNTPTLMGVKPNPGYTGP